MPFCLAGWFAEATAAGPWVFLWIDGLFSVGYIPCTRDSGILG